MLTSNGRKLRPVCGSATSADIKGPDWVFDFDKDHGYEATDPYNVTFQLSLEIGIVSTRKFDSFSCIVSTNHFMDDTFKIIKLEYYTFLILKESILNILSECEGESWHECLVKLRGKFNWEYDGMFTEDEIRDLNK